MKQWVEEKLEKEETKRGIEDWIDWAIQQADRLDPLAESPHSVLDEPHERAYWW